MAGGEGRHLRGHVASTSNSSSSSSCREAFTRVGAGECSPPWYLPCFLPPKGGRKVSGLPWPRSLPEGVAAPHLPRLQGRGEGGGGGAGCEGSVPSWRRGWKGGLHLSGAWIYQSISSPSDSFIAAQTNEVFWYKI